MLLAYIVFTSYGVYLPVLNLRNAKLMTLEGGKHEIFRSAIGCHQAIHWGLDQCVMTHTIVAPNSFLGVYQNFIVSEWCGCVWADVHVCQTREGASETARTQEQAPARWFGMGQSHHNALKYL